MGEEASEGGSLKSWDDIECWEPEETGPAARLGQRLKAQVLEAEEQGCQMRFLKEGCKTLITARLQEHERIIQEFQKRQKKQVLESWKQATSISKFRLKRLGRAMDYWKFVVDDDEEKQRLTLEDRLCQQEHRLKRYQTVGGIALTAMASTFALALVWFLQDRRWKKKFAGQQMEMQCKLNSKDKDFMVELDKTEQRVEKSIAIQQRQSKDAFRRLEGKVNTHAQHVTDRFEELQKEQQMASCKTNARIDKLRDASAASSKSFGSVLEGLLRRSRL